MRLVAPIRTIGQRFALPIFAFAAVAIIVLGRADGQLFDRFRAVFDDLSAPIMTLVSQPVVALRAVGDHVHGAVALYSENARLREENERLLQWQQVARQLEAENAGLREMLKLAPDPTTSYATGRVIANSGGSYVRSALIDAGASAGILRGQAALTGDGLVGRVTEVGDRTARVLLITDLNSRIPVAFEASREHAVLAGDNSEEPRLLYLPPRGAPKIGDRLVTSGEGGVFPPGLPVGIVTAIEDGAVRVAPFADLARLDFLRVVDYGLTGVLPEPVQPRAPKPSRGAPRDAAP